MQRFVFLIGIFCAMNVHAGVQGVMSRAAKNSFLTAQTFPTTFADVSFADKIAVLASGYEPWESEYDASGRCVKNCAYSGITIEDELKYLNNHTQTAVQELRQNGILASGTGAGTQTATTNFKTTTVLRESVPVAEPLYGLPRISSPFGDRIHPVTGRRQLHKGIDFAVPVGTYVYAPADGTVSSVWRDDSCGNGLKISHGMGYETVYCHLQSVAAKEGDLVKLGSVIATSGNTGRSTGAHLHYGIKRYGKYINPSELIGR